jgi:beta-lactamase regulating signal transducer with metallopeptidase domain
MLAEAEPEPAIPDGNLRSTDRLNRDISSAVIVPAGLKWEHLVLIVVLSGALSWWVLATVRIVRFQRALRDVQPVPWEWQARMEALAAQLGLGRAPSVCMVPGLLPPMLWAIGGRPRLLVPSQLWSVMSPDERTSLLLHELAHLKRRDHWVRWLELIVTGLYWWHPVVWWGRRALREAEEQCCDAWVVWAMPRGARTYAAALLAALDFVSGARIAPAAASAIGACGHVSCLKRRLRMIVRANTPKGLSWKARVFVLAAAGLLLPLAPSWAQKSDAEKSATRQREPQGRPAKAMRSDGIESLAQRYPSLAVNTPAPEAAQDRDRKDDVEEKLRDSAERFQEQVKDLIEKLGKELGPVGEEIRKALERAVGEVHRSLEKDGFSAEDLGKALERSGDELRKAFEGGGPVDKELREAIDRSREEIQGALDRARDSVRDQVETLRDRARELTDQERADRGRSRNEVRRGTAQDDAIRLNRQELETARREIRELEQQLRRATRRMEELERRESRRNPAARREPTPRPAPSPTPTEPRVEPAPPQPPTAPTSPTRPARPVPPGARRIQPPGRPGLGGARRGLEFDSDRRLRELEDKMDRLLKELENLKDEKSPKPGQESSSRDARPSTPGSPTVL